MKAKDIKDNEIPEGFDIKLAASDAVPVVLFAVSMAIAAFRFNAVIFDIGALLCILAGCGKVIWKFILACAKKNIFWLNKQFKFLMGAGFILMMISVFLNIQVLKNAFFRIISFPAWIFFLLALGGFVLMGILGAKSDQAKAGDNWREQITNIAAQALLLAGVIIC